MDLDPRYDELVPDFEARFPVRRALPAPRAALAVRGDWTFGAHVIAATDTTLTGTTPEQVADGTVLGEFSKEATP